LPQGQTLHSTLILLYLFVPTSFKAKLQKFPDDLKYVRIHPCQLSAAVNHHYSSDAQISAMRRDQPTETQPSSLVLQVTGMYLYSHALRSTNFFSPASPQSTQPPPTRDPPWEKIKVLCHGDLRGNNKADTICAERGESCRMERECRPFVRKSHLFFNFILSTAESPAASYLRTLISRYPFMRKGPHGKTPLLECRR
jgi:hypothetical protein